MAPTTRETRIIPLSRLLGAALLTLAIVQPLLVLGVILSPQGLQIAPGLRWPGLFSADLPFGVRAGVLCLSVLPALILSAGLLVLRPALAEMRTGRPFARTAFVGLQRLALAILASTVAKILITPAISVLVTWHLETKSLALSAGFGDVQMLVLGVAIWLLAWVMAEGYDLARENAQFI